MRWQERRRSANVEDRRRRSPKGMALGGVGTIVLALVVIYMGGDPSMLLQQMAGGGGAQQQGPVATTPEEDRLADFVAVVLADTEDVWHQLFPQLGRTYSEPTLVLFKDRVESACGLASAAVGPFYCGGDHNVYIDLAFFEELDERFGAPGDFAQAYVVAHEVGHHVQRLLGVSEQVHGMKDRVSKAEYNRLSVRLELQADFYAGVWAHHAQRTRDILERGDLEEALRCASAIGDDRLQREARGDVVPDSFTHGTSAQRVAWFRHGFETGDVREGDTFDDVQFRRVSPR